MVSLGLDIGTTTVSAVVWDENAGVRESLTKEHHAFLPRQENWARVQDAEKLLSLAVSLAEELLKRHPDCRCIGLTGQQHGIVYLDGDGRVCSPLYTWQDGRGGAADETGKSACDLIREKTGRTVPPGYGAATHLYELRHGLVPREAVTFCTIQDAAALLLSGRSTPAVDASDGASFGLFDVKNGRFDKEAILSCGMEPDFFPPISGGEELGRGLFGLPVFPAIGDNQASFFGSAGSGLAVNVGTGGQLSVFTPEYREAEGLETRPFPGGGYLMVGASLCGGRAYAMLEGFFAETVRVVTGQDVRCYDAMEKLGALPLDDLPHAETTFQGTRWEPEKKGSLTSLTEENFTPAHFVQAIVRGMAAEFGELYRRALASGIPAPLSFTGSGNGLRKNKLLQTALQEELGLTLRLSTDREEAACGAAKWALRQAKQS